MKRLYTEWNGLLAAFGSGPREMRVFLHGGLLFGDRALFQQTLLKDAIRARHG